MIAEEKATKRKDEILKIHKVIVAYHKRSWIETDKYEKYLRILDKININDVDYDDKVHRFRKKVDHIKKMNQNCYMDDKNIVETDKKLNKETKHFQVNQSTEQPVPKPEILIPQQKKEHHHDTVSFRLDSSNDIEVSLKESKPLENAQTNEKEARGIKSWTNAENNARLENDMLPSAIISQPKRINTKASNVTTSILKNSNSSSAKPHLMQLSPQDAERAFVEMCVFARLGYLQPPSCLRCAFDVAISKKVVGSCDKFIAWRKDMSMKIHPQNMKDAMTFVKCQSAKEWSKGKSLDDITHSFLTNQ